jgi:hypothetical protein
MAIANVALAAGFGLNFETCDAEVFAAMHELLEQRAKHAERERLAQELKERLGR